MKKFLASITVGLYFVFSCGVMVNLHYCMDEVDSFQLFAASDDICDRCGMHTEDGDGCCRDEVSIMKIDDDQTFNQVSYDPGQQQSSVSVPSGFINFSFYNFSSSAHYQNHSPPLLGEADTYLHNRVFRI